MSSVVTYEQLYFALQNSGIDRLMQLVTSLMPLIMTMVMIMLVIGLVAGLATRKGRSRGLLAILFILLLVAIPVASATASVSPGSTTVYDYMPVTETFRGLATNGLVEYEVRRGDAVTIEVDELYADSSGILMVQIAPYQDYANSYCLYNVTGSATLLTFTIQNNTIMDYLIPIATIMIMVAIISMILGIFTGRR